MCGCFERAINDIVSIAKALRVYKSHARVPVTAPDWGKISSFTWITAFGSGGSGHITCGVLDLNEKVSIER